MTRGVILYGPPAAGKDTIDAALTALSPAYQHFERLKVGPGSTTGYRIVTEADLDDLRHQGAIVWENTQYGAVYAVDAPTLKEALAHATPVLHLGQPEGVAAVVHATPETRWTVVTLHCSRTTAADRLARRDPQHAATRLAVWDVTPELTDADLIIDTDATTPDESARLINDTISRLG
ncbi:MAG: hypothetical protein FWH11_15125 [Micrococcales bacterium]|nr:hypothetical protein [Micrococcales bacterium]